MSSVKAYAINPHIPTISRISTSTVNINTYIERHSKRSIAKNGSDGTDDDEQIITVPGWDNDSEEESAQDESQSDNECETSEPKPTQFDSESEGDEVQPPPKTSQIQGVKGNSSNTTSKSGKKSEKSQKTPSNKKEKAPSEAVSQPKTDKRSVKDETSPKPKGKSKKQDVKCDRIDETAKSIGFESDDSGVNMPPPEEKPKKNNSKSSEKRKSLEDADTSVMPQSKLPDIVGKKSTKKRTNVREFTEPIDNKVFMAYREAIMPFFDPITRGKTAISIEDRFKEMDAFYKSVDSLASKMKKTYGENYSKYNIKITRLENKLSELQYIDGEKTNKAKSPINGQDILKFFKMNPMKKTLQASDVEAFLMGPFIDTVNVLAVNTKPLSLLDYDRLTSFSHFNDVEYQKLPAIEYNMPSYIKLISKLNKWNFSMVFDARSNWLCAISDDDKEHMWGAAVKSFDAFKAEDNDVSETVLGIWDNLLHSTYIKQYIMFGATPNALFGKIFKLFLETPVYKVDMMVLFEGPLEPIACMFTPIHFSYRGVAYGNSDDRPTFADLVKITDDPGMYDPRSNIWIKRLP